jgi:hypothetical protein
MGRTSRWTMVIFCLVFAGLTLSIPLTMPESGVPLSKSLIVVAVLLVIALACFPGRFQKALVRLIAAGVFLGCVAYIVVEAGKPLPDLANYRRSDTNIVNALIAMVIFGVPAAYVAVKGEFPKWTILGSRLHAPGETSEPRERRDW